MIYESGAVGAVPDRLPPDIHIFTSSKQPWVVLPEGAHAVPEFYDLREHWPADSLARMEAMRSAARRPGATDGRP